MDIVTPAQRSRMMSGIRGKNTKPELAVRKLVHALGYRFRLHRRDLPGSPDLVLPRLRKIIFVHGCFWHQHPGCRFAYTPKSNTESWLTKFNANRHRDEAAQRALAAEGWEVLVIWECEISELQTVSRKIQTFLTGNVSPSSDQESFVKEKEHV